MNRKNRYRSIRQKSKDFQAFLLCALSVSKKAISFRDFTQLTMRTLSKRWIFNKFHNSGDSACKGREIRILEIWRNKNSLTISRVWKRHMRPNLLIFQHSTGYSLPPTEQYFFFLNLDRYASHQNYKKDAHCNSYTKCSDWVAHKQQYFFVKFGFILTELISFNMHIQLAVRGDLKGRHQNLFFH